MPSPPAQPLRVCSRLYVIGSGSRLTFTYNFLTSSWDTEHATVRPFRGDHHAMVVYGRNIHVIGGLGGGGGIVQTYNVDSKEWVISDIPWRVHGSLVAARIGEEILVCGGILGGGTIETCGR